MRIVVAAFVSVAALGAFRSSVRAEPTAAAQQAATSAPEPQPSVWDGIYTEEQSQRGGLLYSEKCAPCHAPDLTGGETAPALASADFKSTWSGLSVDDLFERIKVSMPQDNPGSLSRQQTADTLAFVLARGGFPAGTRELAREAEILKQIRFEATRPSP